MGAVNAIYAITGICVLVLFAGFWSQGSKLFGAVVSQAQGKGGERGLFTNLDDRFSSFVERNQDKFWVSWLTDDIQPEKDASGEAAPEGEAPVEGEPKEGDPAVPAKTETGGPGPDGESKEAEETGPRAIGPQEAGPPEVDRVPGLVQDDEVHLIPVLQRLWNQVILEMDASFAGNAARRGVSVVSSWFGSFMGLVGMMVLLPIYTWFLLFELERIHGFVRRHLPADDRQRYIQVSKDVGGVLSSFLRGQLLVCLLKGLTITLGLALAGIPYALFLGLTAGFAALIPFFGASLAAIFTFLVGLLEIDLVPLLWRTILVFGIAELLEGYVYVPRILGGSLGLHPLVVLVAVLAGGAAMGMFGFLLALPLVAALVIVAKEFVMPSLKEWADETDPPGTDTEGAKT